MENPLIDLGKLSEPLTKLVKVISTGIGGVYAPFGTIRQAKADAKAKIIHATADAEVAAIEQRAQSRLKYREELRQENIEKIACQAALALPEAVSSDVLDKDWIVQYFDHAQDVCDDDMQVLWAKILAGEVSSPGSYSKRTLQFLKTMDKLDAEFFTKYCALSFSMSNGWMHFFENDITRKFILQEAGDYALSQHFNDIGLVNTEGLGTPSAFHEIRIDYLDKQLKFIKLKKKEENSLIPMLEPPFGFRAFSQVGQELSRIAGAKPVKGFLEELKHHFESEYQLSIVDANAPTQEDSPDQ